MSELTLAVASKDARVLRVRAVVLEILDGSDQGRVTRVDRPLFVVGTGESADLRVSEPTVSREHLRISLHESGVSVRDEGSKNGTWLGPTRIHEATLTQDTTVKLGTLSIRLRLEPEAIDLPLSEKTQFGDALGESAAMRHIFSILERAAPSDVTVLLEGESGVGKEVLARAIHSHSPRQRGPFVTVDCGAIPKDLMESELFGHQKGSFTGATEARAGLFEQAEGGTLFLDELGELPLDLQPKLLRVLERREVRRVGGRETKQVDTRVIAATNRRLSEAVRRGEFRQDLFYRLAVARVVVPPLRDRPEDVLPLAKALFRAVLGSDDLPSDFAVMLRAYRWPGNVRELRNVIERYALLGIRDQDGLFDMEGSAPQDDGVDLSQLPYQEARKRAVARFERSYAEAVLARADGGMAKAAELAGLARPSFYRLLGRGRAKERDEGSS